MPSFPKPLILNELRKDGRPCTVFVPLAEVVMDALPGERAFEVPPLAAGTVQLEDCVDYLAQAVPSLPPRVNENFDTLPLGIGQLGKTLTPEREFDFYHGNLCFGNHKLHGRFLFLAFLPIFQKSSFGFQNIL